MTKEIVGHAANLYLLEGKESKAISMVELVIVVSEPSYKSDGGGGFARLREMSEIRVHCRPQALRDLARSLGDLANDADELADRTTIEAGAE